MTDRDRALRNADLALADIDRALAPRNTPIDDLVHHPGQRFYAIGDFAWYQAYAKGERHPSGRIKWSDERATKEADKALAPQHAAQRRSAALLASGERRYCWHCESHPRADQWSTQVGDDVCAECRSDINRVDRSPEPVAAPYYPVRREVTDYGEVDGVPIVRCQYKDAIASLKETF